MSKAHAVYSASGSHRWLHCPGSIALSRRAPPQAESRYATEGTEAHACLEAALTGGDTSRYNSEMQEHAASAVSYIMQRYRKAPVGSLLQCEQKVDASPFTCAGQFGTLDVAIVSEFDRLIVVDYKYGAGVAVDPEGEDGAGNSQLVYYALALSHAYQHNFSDVELVVIQPRAHHHTGQTTRSFVVSMTDLIAWESVFKDGVRRCEQADAPLAAGSWCKFCPAAPICPEIKTKALTAAQIRFRDADPLDSLVVPDAGIVPLEKLGSLLDACDKLETWIASVRGHARHQLETGNAVDGWKLVAKRSPRKWRDVSDAARRARSAFGEKAFKEPSLLSPAQLETAIGKGNAAKFIGTHSVAESSGTSMVKGSDKRPAVEKKSAFDVFDDDPDSDLWY